MRNRAIAFLVITVFLMTALLFIVPVVRAQRPHYIKVHHWDTLNGDPHIQASLICASGHLVLLVQQFNHLSVPVALTSQPAGRCE